MPQPARPAWATGSPRRAHQAQGGTCAQPQEAQENSCRVSLRLSWACHALCWLRPPLKGHDVREPSNILPIIVHAGRQAFGKFGLCTVWGMLTCATFYWCGRARPGSQFPHNCPLRSGTCRDAPQRNARTKRKAAPADLAEASSGSDNDLDAGQIDDFDDMDGKQR